MWETNFPVAEPPSIAATSGGAAVGLNYQGIVQIINVHDGIVLTEDEVKNREQLYLKRLMQDCNTLQWLSLVQLEDDNTRPVGLASVYIPLLTTSMDTDEENTPHSDRPQEQIRDRRISAIDMLNRHDRLVITGDPGGGKSAFVDFVVLCLAGELIGDEARNVRTLQEPVPQEEAHHLSESDRKKPKDQPWEHDKLIPLRIILRDFSASEQFPESVDKADAKSLLDFIDAQLTQSGCEIYGPILRARLQSGDVLILFDGLDEVSQASERRERLLRCIKGFSDTFGQCRHLVTSRPYAYQDKDWRLPGFKDAALADFNQAQINRFVQRWYRQIDELDSSDQQTREQNLQHAIAGTPAINELASRPLLLNLIAFLDAKRHDLPERRADLYAVLIELLINKWEKARFNVNDADAAARLQQQSLAEFLKIDQDTVYHVLERLAFVAHAETDDSHAGTADIPGKDLINELHHAARNASERAFDKTASAIDLSDVHEYLCDRVGILYQRGGNSAVDAIYTFPHRSFREFLAAKYIRRSDRRLYEYFSERGVELERERWYELGAHLGRADPDRWREVVLLVGAIDARNEPDSTWDLLERLIGSDNKSPLSEPDAWGVRLALEIIHESVSLKHLKNYQDKICNTVQEQCVNLLISAQLPAIERHKAAQYINQIGDPRDVVTDIDAMRFCRVARGEFMMGDEKGRGLGNESPAHTYSLHYDYYIAQHPVTLAQYQQYVDADPLLALEDSRALNGFANHPVVDISHSEALAFCQWLTRRWQSSDDLPSDWCVTLPNEPEWEKAARGGLKVPLQADVGSIRDCRWEGSADDTLVSNDLPDRSYPWGEEITQEVANFRDFGSGTSAPGVYPEGVSPFGCHDLSGNVWEWTRSWYADYPYPPMGTPAWHSREGATGDEYDDTAARVLRGGSFDSRPEHVRCSVRYSRRPDGRDGDIGFRCVLSPLL